MSDERYEDFYKMGMDFADKLDALVKERYGIENDDDMSAFYDGFYDA
jgi:hypothetical protein